MTAVKGVESEGRERGEGIATQEPSAAPSHGGVVDNGDKLQRPSLLEEPKSHSKRRVSRLHIFTRGDSQTATSSVNHSKELVAVGPFSIHRYSAITSSQWHSPT